MRTMIWKELRENGKWAALAFLCLLLAECYALAGTRASSNYEQYRQITICSPAFLMVSAFGSITVGLALAIVQILPERRRDQWAALLHRPVPRSTIFLGKAAAGMILYGAATIPAFAASAIYAALPGRFAAPFVPGLLLPGLSDLLMGPAFYFGAMLLCLHEGRWFGSRGAIALSLVGVLIVHLSGKFAFGLPVVAGLIYFGASWGALLGNGPGRGQPWAAWLARLIILLAGGEVAILLVMVCVQLLPGKTVVFGSEAEFAIQPDGMVVLSQWNKEGGRFITDLQGNRLPEAPRTGSRVAETLVTPQLFSFHRPAVNAGSGGRSSWTFIKCAQEPYNAKEVWYLLLKQRYFVGYDTVSRRKIGICDVDGFKPASAQPHPFPSKISGGVFDFQISNVGVYGKQVIRLNFAEHTMIRLEMPDDRIYGTSDLTTVREADTPANMAVALENDVRIVAPDDTLLADLPYPHDWRIWPCWAIGENATGDRIYLESSDLNYFNMTAHADPTMFLDVYDAHGTPVASYQHVNPPPAEEPESGEARALALTAPLLPVIVGTLHERWTHQEVADSSTFFGGVAVPNPPTQAGLSDLALLAVLTVVLSVVTWIWARRAGFSAGPARGWALWVLALGVPGLLAFWLAADWPVRVRCPHCGRKRRIDAPVCERCGEPWQAPVASGAEILEAGVGAG